MELLYKGRSLTETDHTMTLPWTTDRPKYAISSAIAAITNRIPSTLTNHSTESAAIITDGGKEMKDQDDALSIDESRKGLNIITQSTRANIIQNIIGHPCMMPSMTEIDYYNPSKSTGTISGHIDTLIENGIVRRLTLPQGARQKGYPDAFFVLSDTGYKLLKQHSLYLPYADEIKSDHERTEKTDKIKRYECAPRPTADVEYDHPLQGDGMTVVAPANRDDSNSTCTKWEKVDDIGNEKIPI